MLRSEKKKCERQMILKYKVIKHKKRHNLCNIFKYIILSITTKFCVKYRNILFVPVIITFKIEHFLYELVYIYFFFLII